MSAFSARIAISMLLLVLLVVMVRMVEGDPISEGAAVRNATKVASSPWLDKMISPRQPGCWNQPWICNQEGGSPPMIKRLCCKNRCVDVKSDVNNCGFCGITCPFTWQCCNGFCINTNVNPFHCGKCWNKCPFLVKCSYGMCGYAEPFPPFPFPPKPPKPQPPFHPKPPHPPTME